MSEFMPHQEEIINKIVQDEITAQIENITLADLNHDELILIRQYWELQNQRVTNRINAIDDELTRKP